MPSLEGDPESTPARFSYTEDELTIQALRARVAELESLLEHILNGFSFHGHPGEACHRTGWTRDETLAKWRTILNHL